MVAMLRKLNDHEKLNLRRLNRLETQEFGRQELLMKFEVDVVDHLLSLNESRELLQFCVSPKLRLEKRVWREMNPKLNRVRPIEQKLKKEYQSASFHPSEDTDRNGQPIKQQEAPDQQSSLKDLIRVSSAPKQNELDRQIAAHVRTYLEVKDDLDED